jgi:small-conductance mechanosensitive channel
MDPINQVTGTDRMLGMLVSIGVAIAAVLVGLIVYRILFSTVIRVVRHNVGPLRSDLLERLRGPIRILIPLFALMLFDSSLAFPLEILNGFQRLTGLSFIAVITWLFINITLAGRDMIMHRYDISILDNRKARAVHTQIMVIVKIIIVVIVIISLSTILMTFDKVRQVGMSILASAGIIGIILGFAAQRSIGTIFAGLQIAVTQPIRIDDVVVVEGEWGRIEEITLTYVVVKTWDLRRVIVPVTYFLEKTFQNWTRISSDLIGIVFLYVDYSVPVEAVRERLREILEGSDKWDKRAWGLQATNSSERTVELRALMSAADSSRLWDLRCEVREKLLIFLQTEYPESLPKVRLVLDSDMKKRMVTPPNEILPIDE